MKRNLITDLIRSFFFAIDNAVYWLIEITYNLFHELAGLGLFGEATYERFTSRIYLLIGVFALFKISFALIGMFVNPDSFTDSKTGGGKLIKKVVTVLLLITFVPTIFQLGYRLQNIIIENNIIATIILGASSDPDQIKSTYQNAGRNMSATVFKAFFRPAIYDKNTGEALFGDCSDCKRIFTSPNAGIGDYSNILNDVYSKSTKEYAFDYNILISTIAALAVAFLLVNFVFDVAIRAVKLSFLQLIAPVPIIMSLDPKKGEEGLKKWISTTVTTYLDLFMRLLIIYFVVFVLAEITKNGGNSLILFKYDSLGNAIPAQNVNALAAVFILFGLLLFAKEAPNLIYEMLGMKPPSGGFGLNPLKRLSSIPLLGGALGAGAALAGGMLGNVTKFAGSALKAGVLKGLGQDDKANKTMSTARNRLANRSAIAKQEAYERYASNKWGGNEKYSGTTISGYEQKQKNEAFQKKQEAIIDSNNKKRLHSMGTEIRGKEITNSSGKKMSYINSNGEVKALTYDNIKELNSSKEMNEAFNFIYGNEEYAASMTSVEYGKRNVKAKSRDLQVAIAKVNQNPGDEEAIRQYEKAAEAAKSAETILKGYEDNHQKIRSRYKTQAEMEDSVKISKGPNVGESAEFQSDDLKINNFLSSGNTASEYLSNVSKTYGDTFETNRQTNTSSNDSDTTGSSGRTPEPKPTGRGSSRPQY